MVAQSLNQKYPRGRLRPFTEDQVDRMKCSCGRPALHQWRTCANQHRYFVCCAQCDININVYFLRVMKVPGRRELLKNYRRLVISQMLQESDRRERKAAAKLRARNRAHTRARRVAR